MRRNYVLGLVLALLGCGGITTETVILNTAGSSQERGSALLTDSGNNATQVDITVAGGTDAGTQTADIRSNCGQGTLLLPLTSIQGGKSTTMVPYPLSGINGGRYFITIYNSQKPTMAQACGAIP